MMVTNLRAKVTTACAGMVGYDAEATVEEGSNNVKYVHANYYGDDVSLTVTDKSVFDYVTGQSEEDPHADVLEEYEGISDAENSKYIKVFAVLDQMLQLMEGD